MWILAGYVIFHYPTSFGCLQHGGCPPAQGTKSQRDEHRSQGTSEEALCYLHRVLQVTEMAGQCVCGEGGGTQVCTPGHLDDQLPLCRNQLAQTWWFKTTETCSLS